MEAILSIIQAMEQFGAGYIATLGIAALCAYLGVFTLLRRIVFTGVALAQLAAAGVAASLFASSSEALPLNVRMFFANYGSTLGSLGVTVLGALGFEMRPARSRISTDALVGVVFAAASALSVLFIWRSSQGPQELANILAGEVLLSKSGELFLLWFGIITVAVVHAKFRQQFLLVSFDPEYARSMRVPVHRLQMILMGTLAVAIALALRIAGLMLVFSFLVMPPLTGLKMGRKLGPSTFFAMCSALAATLLGYFLSIHEDFPVAPSIAVAQLGILIIALLAPIHAIFRYTIQGAVTLVAAAAIVVAVMIFPVPDMEGSGGTHGHEHGGAAQEDSGPSRDELLQDGLTRLSSTEVAERIKAAQDLKKLSDSRSIQGLVNALLDSDETVVAAVQDAIKEVGSLHSTPAKLVEMSKDADVENRILAARGLILIGRKEGIGILISHLKSDEIPPMTMGESVIPLLRKETGQNFGYEMFGEEEQTQKAIKSWEDWWQNNKASFVLGAN